jgi:SAM-dependent methyltransferase
MKEENYKYLYKFEKENWWYRAKRDLFRRILKKFNRRFNHSLDLGCGVGTNLQVLREFSNKVVGIDYSQKALVYSKDKGYSKTIKMSAEHLKFKENTFDLILCSDVIEHIDDKKALDEIYRVLRPKGILIFSVPAHNYLWGPTDDISEHKKRYEKKDFNSILKNFSVIRLGYWNFLMFFPNIIFTFLYRLLGKNRKPKNSLDYIPTYLNALIYSLLKIENKLFTKINMPQGVSIIGICRKN